MINVFKGHTIIKGIILGLLSLLVLEFGTIAVIAGFATERKWWIWYIEDIEIVLLVFNAIIAGLLGVSIAKKLRTIKKIAFILNLLMFIIIISGYAYFIWYRFSIYGWSDPIIISPTP